MKKQIRFQDGKKEDITKILNLSKNGSFLFVGQKGTVVCRDSFLELESRTSYDLCSRSQMEYSKCRKMRMATFSITDATFLDISGHYCIATSNRSLHFLQVTSTDHWETFRLIDMPTIPICLENNFKEAASRQTRELFIGDHVGNIFVFTFLFPRTMLFDRNYTTETQVINFQDLKNHSDYVVCRKLRNVHDDFVDKIIHIPEYDLLFSNAKRDSKTPLVSQNLSEKDSLQHFQHKKGVTCFDTLGEAHFLATGSKDFLVRVWNIFDSKKCLFTLHGHCAVIADVRFWGEKHMLISICKELELKVWGIESGQLLRSIRMDFSDIRTDPFLGKSILHIPSGDAFLLVTCSDASQQVEVTRLLKKSAESLPVFSEESL